MSENEDAVFRERQYERAAVASIERLVILVPTEQDMTIDAYLARYWPNFVCRVKEALRREGLNVRVVVACDEASPATNQEPRIPANTDCLSSTRVGVDDV